MKGDRGDGIPNVMSKDDVFVTSGRQTPLRQKKIDEINQELEDGELLYAASWYAGYCRNEQLIDLTKLPEEIKTNVVTEYHGQTSGDRSKMFNYFVNNKLKILMEHINEF